MPYDNSHNFVFLMVLYQRRYNILAKECTGFISIGNITAIVQSRRLTLFGHIAGMGDNTDAKRILSPLPPEDWRTRGRPRITWLSTIQQDLRSHNLTLPEAMDMAQNRSLWRILSMYGATQS